MNGTSLRIGSIAGVPIHVARSWLIVAAIITYIFKPEVESRLPDIGNGAYVVSAAFAVLLYACVLIHELGHTFVALSFGLPVRRIDLQVLGGVSHIEREPQTPWREFAVSGVGPVVSLALALAAWLAQRAIPDETIVSVLVLELAAANFFVGIFNLLPGLPLDGGRVLMAGVWALTRRRNTALVIAAWCGRALAVLVVLAPFLLARGAPVSPVTLIWGVLIGFSLWTGASQALAAAKLRTRLRGLTARSLARRAHAVTADVPLSLALTESASLGREALLVVAADGHVLGLVNDAAAVAVPEHRRPWVPTADLARAVEPALVLSADLEGEALLEALNAVPASEWLVLERDGTVSGVIQAPDVERALRA